MPATEYHVVPNAAGGWDVRRNNAQRASAHCTTQRQAIGRATDLCKINHAELVVHGKNGAIRYKNSYGPDPYPPRG